MFSRCTSRTDGRGRITDSAEFTGIDLCISCPRACKLPIGKRCGAHGSCWTGISMCVYGVSDVQLKHASFLAWGLHSTIQELLSLINDFKTH
ncbi:hypothetical protein HZ326_17353 [Fusarium oxysporum f. sp. albedinis]|nr:hypothetical protein HZ326_17353 [Fusarium oxysporum f. sp. albedinis]